MGLLPKNELKQKDITPKLFFIWGNTMSGKTFLARMFPNSVIANTDNNAKKVDTPSLDIRDFPTFVSVLQELEAGNHTFETFIIDLVDDIKTMLETYICEKYKVENLADVPFGKAFSDVKMTWKKLMVRISQLPMNVIFISHIQEVQDQGNLQNTIEVPSLELKFYNMTMGRCDMSIKCRKVGNNYIQLCVDKREHYTEADIKDKAVLNVLKNIKGVFANESTIKPLKKIETKEDNQ